MKNRAKCKLCNSVIESFTFQDVVSCDCGEISIWGGEHEFKTLAKNYENFIRIDDDDNEKPVHYVDKPNEMNKMDYKEVLKLLKAHIQSIERLPSQAKLQPVTHYDLLAMMYLMCEVIDRFASD